MHVASSPNGLGLVTASTAATATTAVTAAAASAAAATTTAAATAAIFARSCFVHGKGSPVVLFAVYASDSRLGFFIAAPFDKAETFAPARVAIHDDFATL